MSSLQKLLKALPMLCITLRLSTIKRLFKKLKERLP